MIFNYHILNVLFIASPLLENSIRLLDYLCNEKPLTHQEISVTAKREKFFIRN
jgi:hypothetical protein